eukprot:COSAG01_NODE_950_length_12503_cov_39.622057_2_plen_237_part_00
MLHGAWPQAHWGCVMPSTGPVFSSPPPVPWVTGVAHPYGGAACYQQVLEQVQQKMLDGLRPPSGGGGGGGGGGGHESPAWVAALQGTVPPPSSNSSELDMMGGPRARRIAGAVVRGVSDVLQEALAAKQSAVARAHEAEVALQAMVAQGCKPQPQPEPQPQQCTPRPSRRVHTPPERDDEPGAGGGAGRQPAGSSTTGTLARALFAWQSAEPTDLCFAKGDLIEVLSEVYPGEGWW